MSKPEDPLEPDPNEIDKKLGLLDFYSSRAVAHVSFFIASIFGLIAFSSITNDAFRISKLFYIPAFLLFFGLAYSGYYALVRFGFYANIAEKIAKDGLKQDKVMKKIFIEGKESYSLEKEFTNGVEEQKRLLIFNRLRHHVGRMEEKKGKTVHPKPRLHLKAWLLWWFLWLVYQPNVGLRLSSWLIWLTYWSAMILLSVLVFYENPIEIILILLGLALIVTIAPACKQVKK